MKEKDKSVTGSDITSMPLPPLALRSCVLQTRHRNPTRGSLARCRAAMRPTGPWSVDRGPVAVGSQSLRCPLHE